MIVFATIAEIAIVTMTNVEIRLKHKYTCFKPRGRFRADYGGNSGKHRHKGKLYPVGIPKVRKLRLVVTRRHK